MRNPDQRGRHSGINVASCNIPGTYMRGYPITGLDAVDKDQCRVFIGEADVRPDKGLVSHGGRVIHVVGMGDTKEAAITAAYGNIR